MTAAPTYRDFPFQPEPRRRHLGRWEWRVTDGMAGPTIDTGTAITARGAWRQQCRAQSRCVPAPAPTGTVWTDALAAIILARYAKDLHAAVDPVAFEELAYLAECRCRTDLGARMRALVDDERTERQMRAALTATHRQEAADA